MLKIIGKSGDISIPKSVIEDLGWKENDEVKIRVGYSEITISKHISSCFFCNAAMFLVRIGRFSVCRMCIDKLNNAKDGDYLYPMKVD